jgi:hypothetical protein
MGASALMGTPAHSPAPSDSGADTCGVMTGRRFKTCLLPHSLSDMCGCESAEVRSGKNTLYPDKVSGGHL